MVKLRHREIKQPRSCSKEVLELTFKPQSILAPEFRALGLKRFRKIAEGNSSGNQQRAWKTGFSFHLRLKGKKCVCVCVCICVCVCLWVCKHMVGMHLCVRVCVYVAVWLSMELFIPIVVRDCCESSPFSCLPLLIMHHFCDREQRVFSLAKQPRPQSSSLHQPQFLFNSIYLNYQMR